jgi:hypothetical protein
MAYPLAFRGRPTSVSEFPRSWLNIRIPCASIYSTNCRGQEPARLPKFLTPLSTHTTLFVDPDGPSGASPKRLRCMGFWHANAIAIRMIN